MSRSQVDYYRKTRAVDIKTIAAISEKTALTEGFALKEHRVYKLSLLAALMEKDLLGGILWTHEIKGVGAGPSAEIVEYEEFNKAEVDAYRGVLDDIAAETGGRVKNVDVKSDGKALQSDDTDTKREILRKLDSIAAATGAGGVSIQPDAGATGTTGE